MQDVANGAGRSVKKSGMVNLLMRVVYMLFSMLFCCYGDMSIPLPCTTINGRKLLLIKL